MHRRHRAAPAVVVPHYRAPADSHVTGGTAVLPSTARPEVVSRPLEGVQRWQEPARPTSVVSRPADSLDHLDRSPWARPARAAVAMSRYVGSGIGEVPLDGRHSVVMGGPRVADLPQPWASPPPPAWVLPYQRSGVAPSGVPGDLLARQYPWPASPVVSGGVVPTGAGNQLGAQQTVSAGREGGDCGQPG